MTAIPTHDAQIAAAQARFMQAVSQAITKLITECGYSAERATAALLRELGRGDGGVSMEQDKEHAVFDTMTTFRLGVEDASHALVVSRALERVMKERGLSAVEAINDLSSKLNTTKLFSCSDGGQELEPPLSSSRPSSPQLQRSTPTLPTTTSSDRVSTSLQQQQPRKGRKVGTANKTKNAKKAPKNVSTKGSLRKRSSRERADSVTEAVEQKAKKARLSPEDSPEVEAADATGIAVVRAKRNSATLHEQQQEEEVQSHV